MHIDSELLCQLTTNQIRLLSALLESPNGILSKDLARITAVSNKSATVTAEMKRLLAEHGLEIVIARHQGSNGQALWKVVHTEEYVDPEDDRVDIIVSRKMAEALYAVIGSALDEPRND